MAVWLRAGCGGIVGVWLGLLAHPLFAETLEVPGDYDTIQEAIEEAEDGDTVLVEAGDYLENIDFLGKDITVVSVDGAEDTVIDGSDETLGEDQGTTVTFADGEGNDARLEGFTITGGTGTVFSGGLFDSIRSGGGVVCDGASPTIVDCIITDNAFQGILGIDSSMILEGCVIFGHGSTGIDCDGLYAVVIRDCVIEENSDGLFSAGVYLGQWDFSCDDFEPSLIEGCTFLDNDGGFSGGAITAVVPVDILDCVFDGNTSSFLGGALTLGCESLVADCTIVNNSASFGGGIVGPSHGDMRVERCLIAGNRAARGAAYGQAGSTSVSPTMTFSHCTLADNVDTGGLEGGGAVWMGDLPGRDATVVFENCILWGNGEDPIVEGGGTVEATYSCIEGDLIAGTGNIDEDPLFFDAFLGDYTLDEDSPCIDAGDPDAPDDPDGTPADMGVFFFDQTQVEFVRGDANNSGDASAIPDALYLLRWGFKEGPRPECDAAADVDGTLNALTDPLYLLRWNFQGGDEPPDPGPDECGPDPEEAECEVPPDCG